jgi:tRNA threonylcarbamoyl adenosine modification protein YeaZ
MKILAVEFSSDQRSVAVFESNDTDRDFRRTPPRAAVLGAASESGQRNTRALVLAEQALRVAAVEREQIDCVAVGLGPGSYTGIRIGISLAQGWQLARSVKVTGVSSADCLAAQAQARGWFGRVHVVIDAQRHELYWAAYDVDQSGWRAVEPLRLVTVQEATTRLGHDACVVGPEVERWFAHGRVLFPEADTVGQLAAATRSFMSGENLEPIYLRETSFVKAPPPLVIGVSLSPQRGEGGGEG